MVFHGFDEDQWLLMTFNENMEAFVTAQSSH